MQHILFIADLHLDEKHPSSVEFFNNFVAQETHSAEALYILGDFFELWVGDDLRSPFYESIKTHLKTLTSKIPVYFMHGNRDFLIGKKFARETGCQLLPEFSIVDLYGENVVLLHGDALCSQDQKHMKFRKMTQNPFLRALFLSLPLIIRKRIGIKIRASSKQHHHMMSSSFLEVVPNTIDDIFHHYSVRRMIHGHIHQAKVVTTCAKNETRERIVLGSWEQHGCALKWYANGKREMVFFK